MNAARSTLLIFALAILGADEPTAGPIERVVATLSSDRDALLNKWAQRYETLRPKFEELDQGKEKTALADELAELQASLERKRPLVVSPAILKGQLKLGQIGTLPGNEFRAIDVVDRSNTIAELSWTEAVAAVRGNRAIKTAKTFKRDVWVSGLETREFSDRGLVETEALFAVNGNRTYETTDGGKVTVMMIEPIDVEKLQAELAKAKPTVKLPEFIDLSDYRKTLDNEKDEAAAASLLRFARLFLKSGKRADAVKRLEQIVERYPETSAAKEAKKLIDD